MLVSKCVLPMSRLVARNGTKGIGQRFLSTTMPRASHAPWTYRSFTMPERKFEIWANTAGAFFWWWVFWHLFTDYGHLIGEIDFQDAGNWTDEELGIPPDDAEDPE